MIFSRALLILSDCMHESALLRWILWMCGLPATNAVAHPWCLLLALTWHCVARAQSSPSRI